MSSNPPSPRTSPSASTCSSRWLVSPPPLSVDPSNPYRSSSDAFARRRHSPYLRPATDHTATPLRPSLLRQTSCIVHPTFGLPRRTQPARVNQANQLLTKAQPRELLERARCSRPCRRISKRRPNAQTARRRCAKKHLRAHRSRAQRATAVARHSTGRQLVALYRLLNRRVCARVQKSMSIEHG